MPACLLEYDPWIAQLQQTCDGLIDAVTLARTETFDNHIRVATAIPDDFSEILEITLIISGR